MWSWIDFKLTSVIYSSEADLYETLTPFHLVYGRNILLNQRTLFSDDMNEIQVSKRRLHLCKIIKDYWKRFSSTYLDELHQRHLYRKSKHSNVKSLAGGDVVLIRDDNIIPRCQWWMGRIEELIPGRDGLIRGAKLKAMPKTGISTTCYRPLQKIIPFETVDDTDCNETIKHDDTKNCVNNDGTLAERHELRQIPVRRAAIEGNAMRKVREQYCWFIKAGNM